eukprot:Nitzschia sp. Nitz4//scaffold59_size112058//52291//59043//NITZ4_004109-RA/size112058-snap-gene-0.34-mRNA-1//1//CDS//3329555123//2990//frame0
MPRDPVQRRGGRRDTGATAEVVESPQKSDFHRRPARVGNQFQTRISKSTDLLERPLPYIMSVDFPYVKASGSEDASMQSQDTPPSLDSALDLVECARRTPRLVSRPMQDMDTFHTFVQPFFRSILEPPPSHFTDDTWKQRLVHLHNNEPNGKRSRTSRGNKRKSAEPNQDQLLANMEEVLQQHRLLQKRRRFVTIPEDDAYASEYLYQRYLGNVQAAELGVMVDLSHGNSAKLIKAKENQKTDRSKQAPLTSSESWRSVYSKLQVYSLFEQFYKGSDSSSYGVRGTKRPLDEPDETFSTSYSDEAEDLKGTWKSMLATGKALEMQLDGKSATKPLLSTLVVFVGNAYELPIPESCFGSHHVIVEELSACIVALLEHIRNSRSIQAKLRDMIHDNAETGIDCSALKKFLDNEGNNKHVVLDDVVQYQGFLATVMEWEQRVNSLVQMSTEESSEQNELLVAEELVEESRSHGFKSKIHVELVTRVQKTHALRERVNAWQESCQKGEKGSTKIVSALIKDSLRLKLNFPELSELVDFHREMESWVERANVAIRSRISLTEINSLVQRGEEMPLDLSEYLDKLRSRVAMADEWLAGLNEVAPLKSEDGSVLSHLAWIATVRTALNDGKYAELHELASGGSRIPVEIEAVKILQVELDGKNWASKTKKWIPSNPDSKKGKLEELREHAEKAESLRERLVISDEDKLLWKLEGEDELIGIVEAADRWLEANEDFLVGDNRRNQRRSCLPIADLRKIVQEGDSVYANLGNFTNKMSRILVQAESWYEKYHALLVRCRLQDHVNGDEIDESVNVKVDEMTEAVESAASDVSLDLDEARAVKALLSRIEKWFERMSAVSPKRTKRTGRVPRSKKSLDELVELIKEAADFPIDCSEEVERLNDQLVSVQSWRENAKGDIGEIAKGFDQLRSDIMELYGNAGDFVISYADEHEQEDSEASMDTPREGSPDDMETNDEKPAEATPDLDRGISPVPSDRQGSVEFDGNLRRMVDNLYSGSTQHVVMTTEADVADDLRSVFRWCERSLKYLGTPREIFDKRFFGAFDRFIKEGKSLHEKAASLPYSSDGGKEVMYGAVGVSWSNVVGDQLERLGKLKTARAKFSEWCKQVKQVLNSGDKRPALEKLEALAVQSQSFPAGNDLVRKIRSLVRRATAWVQSIQEELKSGEKLLMSQAKDLLDAGEQLKVTTSELKKLRTAVRAAKTWANKVKKSDIEQGAVSFNIIEDLLEEHDGLLIQMPEELSALQQATHGYCICRRPYEGFMIGCDECEEWYHGSCIGVSESRADRVDKFVCMRCSIKRVFQNSATGAVGIIRKWTNTKDLKKSRQVEYQKHQRKVRKEKKEIEKCLKEISTLLATTNEVSPETSIEPMEVDPPQSTTGTQIPDTCDATENATVDEPESESVQKPSTNSKKKAPLTAEEKEVQISKLRILKQQAQDRLDVLIAKSKDRKKMDILEDATSAVLRRWCIRVRSLVLVPSEKERSDLAKPAPLGEMSNPMISVLSDASILGIAHLSDVVAMENFFKSMSWSLYALSVLRRKPALSELLSVLAKADEIVLPDEKATRTMKLMAQKAQQWQSKVKKALTPKPGVSKPIGLDSLRDLLVGVNNFSVVLPEGKMIKHIIKDKGARHCFCHWPSYGGTMVNCTKCKVLFHDTCVGPHDETWQCRRCLGKSIDPEQLFDAPYENVVLPEEVKGNSGASKHAPDPDLLWPPFALMGSTVANEALNAECCQIPDDLEPLPLSNQHQPINTSTVPPFPTTESTKETAAPVAPASSPTTGAQQETRKPISSEPTEKTHTPAAPIVYVSTEPLQGTPVPVATDPTEVSPVLATTIVSAPTEPTQRAPTPTSKTPEKETPTPDTPIVPASADPSQEAPRPAVPESVEKTPVPAVPMDSVPNEPPLPAVPRTTSETVVEKPLFQEGSFAATTPASEVQQEPLSSTETVSEGNHKVPPFVQPATTENNATLPPALHSTTDIPVASSQPAATATATTEAVSLETQPEPVTDAKLEACDNHTTTGNETVVSTSSSVDLEATPVVPVACMDKSVVVGIP